MCVAGGVSLDDGLKLIAARGRLMQALPAGGVMTSVMADETRVLEALAGSEETVAIAAINAPSQVVISGAGTAIAEIAARLTADGIKTKALTVSHAFHSPLMKPMLAEYERVVREIRFSPPRVPLVSCVDGVLASDEVTRPEYWLRQVLEPVRFAAGMATLEREHVTACIEIGPQPILLGMARQCVSDDGGIEWLPSLRKDSDSWLTLLDSVSRLYVRGAGIDWRGDRRAGTHVGEYQFRAIRSRRGGMVRDLPQLVRSEHGAGLAEREADLQVSSEASAALRTSLAQGGEAAKRNYTGRVRPLDYPCGPKGSTGMSSQGCSVKEVARQPLSFLVPASG